MTGLSHDYTTTLEAEPERVFAALTKPSELARWFAENVDLEPKAGGALRFSGRGAYAPTMGRVLRFEPPTALALSYPIEGADGEVTITLEPAPDKASSTKLSLQHRLASAPPIARAKELVDDLWRLALGNLAEHLRGGAGITLIDFRDPKPEVRLSVFIAAPPSSVFRALVEPALLDQWIATKAVVEPRVGGRYSHGWSHEIGGRQVEGGPTRILELVQDEKLVVDWPDWRGDTSVPVQKLTYLLAPEGAGTRVTLIHDGFGRAADISDYPFGWAWFAGRLKDVAERPTKAAEPASLHA